MEKSVLLVVLDPFPINTLRATISTTSILSCVPEQHQHRFIMATPSSQAAQPHSQSTSEKALTEEKTEFSTAEEVEVPPNGGTRAWLQVLGSALIFCNLWYGQWLMLLLNNCADSMTC